ncbi:hypothetical protein VTL71DRAFT_10622 [Oculimacula yallundae]|uniref:Uncharacterized protein n=1 Tax=Oculimacula yallundae TaxID=86028 RepID=A0ABR4CVA1_9HELO
MNVAQVDMDLRKIMQAKSLLDWPSKPSKDMVVAVQLASDMPLSAVPKIGPVHGLMRASNDGKPAQPPRFLLSHGMAWQGQTSAPLLPV